jgi:hypothetical protein
MMAQTTTMENPAIDYVGSKYEEREKEKEEGKGRAEALIRAEGARALRVALARERKQTNKQTGGRQIPIPGIR